MAGESESEEEGAEKEGEDCDSPCTVHCIASFWARRRGRHALVEVSPEFVALGLPSLPRGGDSLTELKYESLSPAACPDNLRGHRGSRVSARLPWAVCVVVPYQVVPLWQVTTL